MLVAEKRSSEETIIVANESPDMMYIPPRNRVIRRIKNMMRRYGVFLNPREKYEWMVRQIPSNNRTFFTSPLSQYDLAKHPLVKNADLIHLHWVANFIDYPSFFSCIDKPIVWTLHDENLAYGGFHYGREKQLFYPYYSIIEDSFCKIKKSSLERCDTIHVVALSKMMKTFYASDSFLANREISIIHNGIDTSTFRVFEKSVGRHIYRIPENNLVIVFCCANLADKRKGLAELIAAISMIGRDDITLLCIGNDRFKEKNSLDIRYTGPITNGNLLSMTYSCGDVFAFPSFQEAFAQTPLEAIASGLPIVAFPCSGMEELITANNGIICRDFTIEALHEGLKQIMDHTYNRQQLQDDINNRFSIDKISAQYCQLYNSLV